MLKFGFYILFLTALFTACGVEKKTPKIKAVVQVKKTLSTWLDTTITCVHYSTDGKQKASLSCTFQVFRAPKNKVEMQFNAFVYHWLLEGKNLGIKADEMNPKQFFRTYIDSLYARSTTSVLNQSPEIVWHYQGSISRKKKDKQDWFELCLHEQGYIGGAHENVRQEYVHLSTQNGEKLSLSYFFNDLNELDVLAEEAFRKKNDLSSEVDLADAGFWFEKNTFVCPENFSFTNTGILFQFNLLEIGPREKGMISFELPYDSIEGLGSGRMNFSIKQE